MLFEASYLTSTFITRTNYDVASDGRFVMIRTGVGAAKEASAIHVVLDWLEELERLVPTDN